ncbi:ML domain-containing protein [Chytriomyces cf. hyalinus JEL632]|nr:ML domain-containing protein [Chytriomyces cf. hyalinus JEL632]
MLVSSSVWLLCAMAGLSHGAAVQKPLVELSDSMHLAGVTATSQSIEICSSPEDIFSPQRIDMNPDPPKRGAQLDVAVVGELSETVLDGAYIKVIVKLGIIKLYDGTINLCEEAGKIGHPCPIEKGHQEVFHTVDMPREVPPGKYDIDVKAFNNDDKPLTCLKIKFRM